MKTSSFSIIATLLLLNLSLFAQNGKSKTMITTLDYDKDNTIVFDLNGSVEVNEWKEEYVRVVIYLTTNLQNEGTLNILTESDRYFVDAKVDEYNNMKVTNPFMDKIITVNGKPLQEQIRYEVFVPDYSITHVLANDEMELAVQ